MSFGKMRGGAAFSDAPESPNAVCIVRFSAVFNAYCTFSVTEKWDVVFVRFDIIYIYCYKYIFKLWFHYRIYRLYIYFLCIYLRHF